MRVTIVTKVDKVSPHTINHCYTTFTGRTSRMSRVKPSTGHCQISYREGLGMSPCIMGLTKQDPYILKEHIKLYKILKFRANWANIEQDTAIQKLKNVLTNV